MTFFVRFWGTRGSIPTPSPATKKYGGNTSCVEIRVGSSLFICDAGTGIRELGLEVLRRADGANVVGHMFFSHTHWDHIQGFPFFAPAYNPAHTFMVYGTSAGDTRIHQLLSGQMRSDYFPVDFHDLRGRIVAGDMPNGERDIDGVMVRAFEQLHPGRSFAYAFYAGGKKVVFATDNELDATLPDRELPLRDPSAIRPLPTPFIEFIRDADLLIADAQYLDSEYPNRIGWGHARATTCVDAALLADVKQLALFHHDPMHGDGDVDRKVEVCKERARQHESKLVVFGAREGVELRI